MTVIGPSPISNHNDSGYTGADAAGVIIRGTSNFGATLDYPFGHLREIYDVLEIPSVPVAQMVHEVQAAKLAEMATSFISGPTPEQVFADKAPGKPPEEGQTRGRTPIGPLGEPPKKTKDDGPLGPRRKKAAA